MTILLFYRNTEIDATINKYFLFVVAIAVAAASTIRAWFATFSMCTVNEQNLKVCEGKKNSAFRIDRKLECVRAVVLDPSVWIRIQCFGLVDNGRQQTKSSLWTMWCAQSLNNIFLTCLIELRSWWTALPFSIWKDQIRRNGVRSNANQFQKSSQLVRNHHDTVAACYAIAMFRTTFEWPYAKQSRFGCAVSKSANQTNQ